MSLTVTLTLDDDIGAYLERIAADQGRTPAELAAWIVSEDVRRERKIDADLVARLDHAVAAPGEPSSTSRAQAAPSSIRERAGA
ncbi:MAG TPA: hypothetical protein VHB98_15215 [Chloroflexota bacterium]|jgi:predicted transcriptional regulator|nr:hypothetical protein [Chloroflexota bacterium]